jgi:uncharacterized YccA/Bax inhibitor family protein
MDPVSKRQIGTVLIRGGVISIIVGAIGGLIVALVPTDPAQASATQDLVFALACCLGPGLLGGIPAILVGRMMLKRERRDDIGSLYRGDY